MHLIRLFFAVDQDIVALKTCCAYHISTRLAIERVLCSFSGSQFAFHARAMRNSPYTHRWGCDKHKGDRKEQTHRHAVFLPARCVCFSPTDGLRLSTTQSAECDRAYFVTLLDLPVCTKRLPRGPRSFLQCEYLNCSFSS